MKKKIFFFSLSLFSAVAVVAQISQPLYLDESQPIEVRVQDALSRMTLEEKVKLCTAQSKFSSHGVSGNSSVPRQSGISFHCAEGFCGSVQGIPEVST